MIMEIDVFDYPNKDYPPALHHLVKTAVTEKTRTTNPDDYKELSNLILRDLNNYIKSDLGYNIDADLYPCSNVEDKELHIHTIAFTGTPKDLVHFKLKHL